MKYAVEMGSGTTIYIPNLIKNASRIQKLLRGIHRHTFRQKAWWSHKPIFISLFSLFWGKKIKVGLCDLHPVCMSMCPRVSVSLLSAFERLNQSLWNLACMSRHLDPSQCRAYILDKSPPPVCVSNTRNSRNEELLDAFFYAVRVILQKSPWVWVSPYRYKSMAG
jgi:hypothetical protein